MTKRTTPKIDVDAVRQEFEQFLQDHGYGAASAAARGMGFSVASISQWRTGKYNGDQKRIAAACKSFMERERGRMEYSQYDEIPFVDTTVSLRILAAAQKVHLSRSMALLYGPAGVGKTRSIKEYALRNQDVILIESDSFARTKDLLASIHKAVGMGGAGKAHTEHTMLMEIVERLKDSGRMIIIDEAENLRPKTLDAVRRIHDWAGVGVLYVGLDKFYHQLRTLNNERYDYLVTRLRAAIKVERLEFQDTQLLTNAIIPGNESIAREMHTTSRGVARILVDLCKDVAEYSNASSEPITHEVLAAFASERVI